MIRIIVKNQANVEGWKANFPTQEAASAWIAQETAKNSWGLAERWVRSEEEPVDAVDLRTVIDVPAGDEHEEISHLEYKLPAEYTVIQTDVTSEYTSASIVATLESAKSFGDALMNQFTVENIMLGITQDNMTSTVRKAMVEVISALTTGSLYDAIQEMRAIPSDKKDAKYITNARLVVNVNKIETYLGKPVSTQL